MGQNLERKVGAKRVLGRPQVEGMLSRAEHQISRLPDRTYYIGCQGRS